MLMRIGVFVMINLAIMFLLNMMLFLVGVNQPEMDWEVMLAMVGVMGLAGAFVSFLMSKSGAKHSSATVYY